MVCFQMIDIAGEKMLKKIITVSISSQKNSTKEVIENKAKAQVIDLGKASILTLGGYGNITEGASLAKSRPK